MSEELTTPQTETKRCTGCLDIHHVGMFYKKGNTGRTDARCRTCRAAAVRQYRINNPDRVREIQKRTCAKHSEKHRARAAKWYQDNHAQALAKQAERRQENPEAIRDGKLRAAFGIGVEEYNQLLIKQDHKCAICGRHESSLSRRLAVDHCHINGHVRGLLCSPCNTGLGSFRDTEQFLTNAINYLKAQ